MITNHYEELMNNDFDVRDFILKNFVQSNFEINYRKIEQAMPNIVQIQSQTCEDIATSVDSNLEDYVEISVQLTALQSQLNSLTVQFSNIQDAIILTQDNLQQRIYQINVIVENLKLIQTLEKNMKDLRKLVIIINQIDNLKLTSNFNLLEICELIMKSRIIYQEVDKSPHCRTLIQQFDLLQQMNHQFSLFQNQLEKEFINCLTNFDKITFQCILKAFSKMSLYKTPEKLLVQFLLKPKFDIAFQKLNKNLLTKDNSNLELFLNQIIQIFEDNQHIAELSTDTFSLKHIIMELLYIYLCSKECVNIYSLGVLDLFQQNYQCIQNLKLKLDVHFQKGSDVEKKFLEKWNLQTYFQMRQAEIIKQSEQELQIQQTGELNFLIILNKFTEMCFSDRIFIQSLNIQFITLSIQLITRICSYIKVNKDSFQQDKIPSIINNISKATFDILPLELRNLQLNKIKQVVSELIDISIVQIKQECLQNLEPFNGIPAKFRMTNRETPTQPSNFCQNIFKPLQNFLIKIDENQMKQIASEKIYQAILDKFQNIKKQALDSCDKNEELMAKMGVKKSDALDNQKIKIQFQLDEDEIRSIMITKLYQ